jgi:hypothetical protein
MKWMWLVLLLGLASCEPRPDMQIISEATQNVERRFTIQKIAVFSDALAYDGKRGIYIVVDLDTKKEFIGVSGIGISELGSHKEGKITVQDER